jgi:hypothetical protein
MDGSFNTAIGRFALQFNQTGGSNVAVGFEALNKNTSHRNTAVGRDALFNKTTGTNNVAIGFEAGKVPVDSNYGIFIGNPGVAGDQTTIRIGEQGTQTRTFIAGISGVTIGTANDATVFIDTTTGQLGSQVSSRRYKEDIQPMGDVTAMLQELRPVTYRYKKPYDNGGKPMQYGLIAEEVAEVLPALAVFNNDGTPETVKYHLLPTFLLAGYQQQQTIIAAQAERDQQQADEIAELKRRLLAIETLLPRVTTTAARQ